ncbi:CHASE2 domain-containing protein [Pseudomonas fluorescens]|uniref:CHASE2 domain-containing protein n=1 Tax=Pseudomonas fluorescens TaxID=294 RepID=A0A5E7EKI2_PSEFL|nr:CHASE2 domain-containing protein [Pseudomonas fluorescens]VVO27641.1 hypothetical protein PS723_04728 [Pseudomonas fluorescens]
MPKAFQSTDSRLRTLRRCILARPRALRRWILALPHKLRCWILALPHKLRCWIIALPHKLRCWIIALPRALGDGIAGLLHHLPGALVVASLVTIGHLHFHLLDAIDSYAFIGIGNLSAVEALSSGAKKPSVAVVLIDQSSYETNYHERSPLDRCQLRDDLKFLYDLPIPPRLLVIDLDLSPGRGDVFCQNKLNELLINGQSRTKTVLMAPLPVNDPLASDIIQAWRETMEDAKIAFGDPNLPIRYGLVTKIECEEKKLAAVALDAAIAVDREVPSDTAVAVKKLTNASTNPCRGEQEKKQSKEFLINPKQYVMGLRPVSTYKLSTQRELFSEWPGLPPPWQLPVVFFGGSYGEDDTYLTPLGTMYGVEVHAAAYMSLVEPATLFSHLRSFGLEIGIAVLFGGVISFCWRHYFAMRFSPSPPKRQFSTIFVWILGLLLMALVMVTTAFSLCLLSTSNSWLSPIPIALGMLIESFFVGAVHEAVKEGDHQREMLVGKLKTAHENGPAQFDEAIAAEEMRQRPEHPRNLCDRCSRFIIGDVARHIGNCDLGAALFLLVRRLALFALLGFALSLIFRHH